MRLRVLYARFGQYHVLFDWYTGEKVFASKSLKAVYEVSRGYRVMNEEAMVHGTWVLREYVDSSL